ncbi:MAG: tyrosine--tRNA ligase [Chloroflexota bacterium]|nr:tyrosine--tRNA ligase [Chloroflexota bacterium]
MPDARVPTEAELDWVTRRAVAEIIPYDDFVRALQSGRSLRLKMGFDPSAPDLTLGHAVGLRKLRQLQDLGHHVVIIVGDWTARIGDPSGQSKTRPMLTEEQVKANAETYLKQFFRIVDREMTEVRWQSEWFNDFTLANVVRLAAKFTVAQMLERADFAERFATQKPISIHELLYPLLQAYDSVAVKADVELGGTDQKFNLMVGRELQPDFEQRPQIVYTVPLLVGTDGEIKMSKSLGNYVAVEDPPNEMYGKLMSVPDKLIADYIELLTDVPDDEVAEIRESIEKRTANPRDAKMRMAREIVAQFHNEEASRTAEDTFVRTFSKRELPDDVALVDLRSFGPDIVIAADGVPKSKRVMVKMRPLLVALGLAPSTSQALRLIDEGAVEVNGEKVTSPMWHLSDGDVIRVGKHRFVRVVDADAAAP